MKSDELTELKKTLNENVNTNTKFNTMNERNILLERDNEVLHHQHHHHHQQHQQHQHQQHQHQQHQQQCHHHHHH